MWYLIPTILYLTYGEAGATPNDYVVNPRQHDHSGVAGGPFPSNYNPSQRSPAYVEPVSRNDNNFRQSQSQSQSIATAFVPEPDLLDLGYGSRHADTDTDPNNILDDGPSYFEDLELVENVGNYLREQTQLDESSSDINDAPHQYNALLGVIVALARSVRNACTDFDQVYDNGYVSTVYHYYRYGSAHAEKVALMVEDYIRKGISHMPRLWKLKHDLCEKDQLYCSVTLRNKIKASSLIYVKELENLEALAHLSRRFYSYIDEFDEAAQKGNVLPYLQNGKERLREYVMEVVNTLEHITDKPIKCP